MVRHYESFFSASAGASAAILGLLVVAVSVVNADDADPTTRELRTVLAGSAFVVLVDIFFVSIVTLTGGAVVLGSQASRWRSSACSSPDGWSRGPSGLETSPLALETEN